MVEQTNDLGQYYAQEDYAGVFLRWLIILVDGAFLCFAFLIFIISARLFGVSSPYANHLFTAGWYLFCYSYLALLKATPLGTFGYLLAGVKLVDYKGNRPSVVKTTRRFLVIIFVPWNFLLDLNWLENKDARQTFGDRMGETFVVKRHARPIGSGQQVYVQEFVDGMCYVFREIRMDRSLHSG